MHLMLLFRDQRRICQDERLPTPFILPHGCLTTTTASQSLGIARWKIFVSR